MDCGKRRKKYGFNFSYFQLRAKGGLLNALKISIKKNTISKNLYG